MEAYTNCAWCGVGPNSVLYNCDICELPLCRKCTSLSNKGGFLCEACYRDRHGYDYKKFKIEINSCMKAQKILKEAIHKIHAEFTAIGVLARRIAT